MSTNPQPTTRLERYIHFVIRQRWGVLIASFVLSALLGAGVSKIGLANDYRVFFSDANPDLIAFEEIEATFTKNDNVLLVVQPKEGTVFNPRTLAALRDLTDAAWKIPFSTRVDSITNFQHTEAEEDELIVEDLYPSWATSQEEADRAAAVALAEPLLVNRLVSPDARTTALNIRIELDATQNDALPQVAPAVRELRDEFVAAYPDHRVALTGLSMLNNAFAEAPLKDMPIVMPLMFGILALVMVMFLRSFLGSGATFVVIMFATLSTIGVAGHLGLMLDPVSASVPTIILTLAVADSVHILMTFFASMRAGRSKTSAIVESFRVNAQPVFLTSLTTVIGFLSLNASDAPPYRLLGNLTALGVALAWLFSMTTLPSLLSVLPMKASKSGAGLVGPARRLAEFVVARPRAITYGLGGVVVAIVLSMSTLVVNDKFVEYFDTDMAFRRDTDFTMENLSGIYQLSYSIPSGESQGVGGPEYLATVDGFAEYVREQPGVVHVNTFTDTMKRLNMNMHGDDPEQYRLPDSQPLGAQFLLLYELSLPFGLDVNDQIDIDKSKLRVDVTFGDVGTAMIMETHESALAWLDEHGTAPMREHLSGSPALMFSNITMRNIEGMLVGTGIGFAIIALIIAFALKSPRLGFLSLIPNILPAALAFGVWALLFHEVGFAVSVIAGLSMGIIVDDTVHFLSKYQRARREHSYSASDAVIYAFEAVGPAIVGTTIIVAAGFAMLGLSSFRVTSYMGLLTSIAVIAALITDLLLLPALLVLIDSDKAQTSLPMAASLENAA